MTDESGAHRSLALKGLALAVGLIVYGSLYPFTFSSSIDAAGRLLRLSRRVGRGDLVANLVLYAPLGYCGYFALDAGRYRRRLLWLVLGGTLLSLTIEVLQAFERNRVSSWNDVALNVVSTVLGIAGAMGTGRLLARPQFAANTGTHAALLLLALWAASRLSPFVPLLTMAQLADAVRPLFNAAWPDLSQVVYFTAIWLVVARLLAEVAGRVPVPLAAVAVAVVMTAARLIVIRRQLVPAELAGFAVAALLWLAGLRRAWLLAAVLVAAVAVDGLRPFHFDAANTFVFVPFRPVIGGPFEAGVQSILTKLFLGGAVAWLLLRAGWPLARVLAAGATLFLAIEMAQTRLAGRVPEVTDPLLFVAVALVVHALDEGAVDRRSLSGGTGAPPVPRPDPADRRSS